MVRWIAKTRLTPPSALPLPRPPAVCSLYLPDHVPVSKTLDASDVEGVAFPSVWVPVHDQGVEAQDCWGNRGSSARGRQSRQVPHETKRSTLSTMVQTGVETLFLFLPQEHNPAHEETGSEKRWWEAGWERKKTPRNLKKKTVHGRRARERLHKAIRFVMRFSPKGILLHINSERLEIGEGREDFL